MRFSSLAAATGLVSAIALAAAPAAANELEISGSAALNIEAETGDGLSHSASTAEVGIDLSYGGAFGGIWVGTLYDDPSDELEIELSLGYGGEFAPGYGYGITYTHYFLNNSGEQGYDLTFGLSATVSEQSEIGLDVIYAPEDETTDVEGWIAVALTDRWSLAGLVGKSQADNNTYYEFGVGYALTDSAGLGLLYEDADDSDGTLTFSVTYDFDILGG